MGRYFCEVAARRDAHGDTWHFIVWEVDAPGMRWCEYASYDEGMMLYDRADAVSVPRVGVRLRSVACRS